MKVVLNRLVALMVALVLALSACGGDDSDTDNGDDTSVTTVANDGEGAMDGSEENADDGEGAMDGSEEDSNDG